MIILIDYTNIIYIISALNILLIFVLTNIYFDEKKYVIFFYIIILMLSLITLFKITKHLFTLYLLFSKSLHSLYTHFINSSETFWENKVPDQQAHQEHYYY